MDLTMESDAMSEISEISTTTRTQSKKLRFGTRKQKQAKDQPAASDQPTSKSSSILTLSRRSGNKKMKSLETLSDDLTSPTSQSRPDAIGERGGSGPILWNGSHVQSQTDRPWTPSPGRAEIRCVRTQ